MPAERVPMRCVREILRLKYGCGATDRMIASSTGLAHSTVGDYLDRATAVGLSWPLPPTLTDVALRHVDALTLAGTIAEVADRVVALTRTGIDGIINRPFAPEGGTLRILSSPSAPKFGRRR
jgi:hypothetical protein